MDVANILHFIFIPLLLLQGAIIGRVSSSPWTSDGDVIELTENNFNVKTKQYDLLLVMFYVRWCSHCRRMHQDYEKAGTTLLKDVDPPVHLAKLDCTNDDSAQCEDRYGIKGYPSLRIYRYGHYIGQELNYGNRTKDELVKTMTALKNNFGQQDRPWSVSSQTDGVEGETNTASISVQSIWLLVVLFITFILPI